MTEEMSAATNLDQLYDLAEQISATANECSKESDKEAAIERRLAELALSASSEEQLRKLIRGIQLLNHECHDPLIESLLAVWGPGLRNPALADYVRSAVHTFRPDLASTFTDSNTVQANDVSLNEVDGQSTHWSEVFSQFDDENVLGSGGMGVVYLAEQKTLGRKVAVKKIRPDRHSAAVRAAFIAEARTTAQLDHPGIVPVYEQFMLEKSNPAFAMKIVNGIRLSDMLKAARSQSPKTGFKRLLEILIKLCQTLAYAHDRGFVHLDLKPSNVMIGDYGEVYLLDWGLAVLYREDKAEAYPAGIRTRAWLEKKPCGTPLYMAPEQCLGQSEKIGPATDVYLLGALLYEILEQRPPHANSSLFGVLRASLRQAPLVFSKTQPTELKILCEKSLDPDPTRRPQSVRQFQQTIEEYFEHAHSYDLTEQTRHEFQQLQQSIGPGQRDKSDLYLGLSECLARLQQAQLVWPENEQTQSLEQQIREHYASLALKNQDWGLASAQSSKLLNPQQREALKTSIHNEQADTEFRQKRLNYAVTGLILLVISLLSIGSVTFYGQNTQLRQALTATEVQKRAAERHLKEFNRLVDVHEFKKLKSEANALYPNPMQSTSAVQSWLDRAFNVQKNLIKHKAQLAQLKKRASPYTEAQRLQDRTTNEKKLNGQWHREWLNILRAGRHSATVVADRELTAWVDDHIRWLENYERHLDLNLDKRLTWKFANPAQQWQFDLLQDFVATASAELDDANRNGVLWRMKQFLLFLNWSEQNCLSNPLWDQAIAAIQDVSKHPEYNGLKLRPQRGLLPIGVNPKTNLWEFSLVVPTLTIPGYENKVPLDKARALTLTMVLIPSGRFLMGPDQSDELAHTSEYPVEELSIEPFFLSKYELTQEQYQTMTGENPSAYPNESIIAGVRVHWSNPLENVNWQDSTTFLKRFSLELPTEAQWEYAAQSGASTLWSFGHDPQQLSVHGNIADQSYQRWSKLPLQAVNWDDKQAIHCPVGSFKANKFGLFDMIGNVAEWVREGSYPYGIPRRNRDSEAVLISKSFKLHRGGSYASNIRQVRSSARGSQPTFTPSPKIGIRPARAIQQ